MKYIYHIQGLEFRSCIYVWELFKIDMKYVTYIQYSHKFDTNITHT